MSMWRNAMVWGVCLCAAGCMESEVDVGSGGTPDELTVDMAVAGSSHDQGSATALDLSRASDMSVEVKDQGRFMMLDDGASDEADQGNTPPDMRTLPPGEGSAGCAKTSHPGSGIWTLSHGGITREFKVSLPPGHDSSSPAPVVFDFHGRNMNATTEDLLTNLSSIGNARGFIVVHPEGTGGTWNAGTFCCGSAQSNNIDDVGFTAAMIDRIAADLCINPGAVFVTGMSNGGFMSHTIGCELADKVAAIAPVAGTLANFSCNPSRPVSVFHFHGTDDSIVPYGGYDPILGTDSVDNAIDTWIDENGCDNTGQAFLDQDDVVCRQWSGCDASTHVRLCKIKGGGHTWPGGTSIPGLGHTTQTISASTMMLDFFLAHAR